MTSTTSRTTPFNPNRLADLLPPGLTEFAGRTLLALMFVLAGYSKLGNYDGNLAYMASAGVPGFLLPPVIALELLGGIALIVGFQVRLIALLMAIFCVSSAFLFHFDLADQMQFIMFFKNLAIAGGFLLLSVQQAGPWTLDRKLGA